MGEIELYLYKLNSSNFLRCAIKQCKVKTCHCSTPIVSRATCRLCFTAAMTLMLQNHQLVKKVNGRDTAALLSNSAPVYYDALR